MSQGQGLSYIEPHEIEEAESFVLERLKTASGIPDIKPFKCSGYHMAVMLYIRPEEMRPLGNDKDGNPILAPDGTPACIYIPNTVTANDKWVSCTALVVAQGPESYKGARFKESGPWCRVGDWVVIPRNEGIQISYRGVPMQIIPDDRVLGIVEDPAWISRD